MLGAMFDQIARGNLLQGDVGLDAGGTRLSWAMASELVF